jgi:23S rRNA (uracil1939-C5)-methyltransferase
MATPANLLIPRHQGNASIVVGGLYDVEIEKIVYGGDGLARIGQQAVFVPYAAVGDRLRIRIVDCERNFARGVIDEVLSGSPSRREAPCPHYGVCGGCQLQHLEYGAQLEAKVSFIRESLARLGGVEWKQEIGVRSVEEFGYRSRAEIKVSRDHEGQPRIGFYRAASQEVCEVESCRTLLPAADRQLQRLHAEPSLIPHDATRVYLTAGDDEVIITPANGENGRASEYDSLGTAHQRIAGINYEFGVKSFFQGNRLLAEELLRTAIGDAKGALAVDLYAGVGFFSLQLAKSFEHVCAVEGNKTAASHGVENARLNGTQNVRYEPISVEAWLKYKSHESPQPDLVLLDPPRAGAGLPVIERLAALDSPLITYVSCDPATLARDLKALLTYGYKIDSITALDMFPQTFHVETVVQLQRGEEAESHR